MSGKMNLALKAVCDEYGPLARIGPNELVTCDPDILRRIWGVRSQYRRGAFYDAVRFDPERDNLISLRDDAKHSELKAKMAMGVSLTFPPLLFSPPP
jgi:hypothetical protein